VRDIHMRLIKLILFLVLSFVLASCNNQPGVIKDLTKFSTDKEGEYLLFHFTTPFTEDGYIKEVDKEGKELKKYSIKDERFAPSDVFIFDDKYYFVSGAYSNDTKIIEYNPKSQLMSLVPTHQENFVEKYFKNNNSQYITTVLDKNENNDLCDINKKKCIRFSEHYRTHDVTVLDDSLIAVGVAINNQDNAIKIKKMNKNMETIKEVDLNNFPNYFTFTSPDQKLYLFMVNGEIVEVDSELNIEQYPMDISSFTTGTINVTYQKNVMLDPNTILMNLEINESDKKTKLLAKISFKGKLPKIEVIDTNLEETILNVDYKSSEVFTRTYVGKNTIINIRDAKTLKIKHSFKINNNDPIYFIDNISK
jgi:predicted small secreted protein